MRRFEFSDGKSHKFWQIAVEGDEVTTHWGRIGTKGQSKTKSFDNPAAAEAAMDKQIRAKTKKGYAEVEAPGKQPPTPAEAPAPPAKEASETPEPPPPAPEDGTTPEAPAAALEPLPPFEPYVDLSRLTRWPIRGVEPFTPPKDVGKAWTARQLLGLQPESLEALRRGLAAGEVPDRPLADFTGLFTAASERSSWRGIPGEVIDPLAAADPLHALEVAVELVSRLEKNHVYGIFVRLGDWLSAASDEVWVAAAGRGEEAAASTSDVGLECLALALRSRELADRAIARAPNTLHPCVAALSSTPAKAFATYPPSFMFSPQEALTLAMQIHGLGAEDAVLLAGKAWDRFDRVATLQRVARCITPDVARFFGGFTDGTKKEVAVAPSFLETHPELVLRVWGQEPPKPMSPADFAFKAAVIAHPELARRAALGGRADAVEELLAGPGETADEAEWPAILRDPPWRRKPLPKSTVDAVLDVDMPAPPPRVDWAPGERERLSRASGRRAAPKGSDAVDWHGLAFHYSADTVRRLLASHPEVTGYLWGDAVLHVLAKAGVAHIGWILDKADFREALPALARAGSVEVAPAMAEHYDRKSYRPVILSWALAYPLHAITGLVPLAFAKKKDKLRAKAQTLLGDVVRSESDGVDEAIAAMPDEVRATLHELRAIEPRFLLPKKRPKPPAWLAPAFLPAVRLHNGDALPPEAIEVLVEMLAFSKLDDPYIGIEEVKAACTAASLEAFALGLYELWLARNAASTESFCLKAVGHFGGDTAALKLTPAIRRWPGESAHARAVIGLDVLRAIGTDVALMQLYGISQKLKYKGLKNKAGERVQEIAEARGLSPSELADRLVPDLGLDPDGSRWLDFGPRKFRVGFDEALKPWVADESGKRRKSLPKVGKRDDADKGAEATRIWKALKKSARATAKSQLERLERAMVDQRRWRPADWRRFFLAHPLMIHLVRRLVWGVYEDGALTATFRVDEGGELADAEDDEFTVPEGSEIGIPHRLELGSADAWAEVLGDYEILQPFDQLSRPVHARTEAEADAKSLDRAKGEVVHWGKVRALERRGWQAGVPQDAGCIWEFLKPVPGGLEVALQLEPGLFAGAADYNEDQTLGEVWLRTAGSWHDQARKPWGSVSEVVFSEVVADLLSMTEG